MTSNSIGAYHNFENQTNINSNKLPNQNILKNIFSSKQVHYPVVQPHRCPINNNKVLDPNKALLYQDTKILVDKFISGKNIVIGQIKNIGGSALSRSIYKSTQQNETYISPAYTNIKCRRDHNFKYPYVLLYDKTNKTNYKHHYIKQNNPIRGKKTPDYKYWNYSKQKDFNIKNCIGHLNNIFRSSTGIPLQEELKKSIENYLIQTYESGTKQVDGPPALHAEIFSANYAIYIAKKMDKAVNLSNISIVTFCLTPKSKQNIKVGDDFRCCNNCYHILLHNMSNKIDVITHKSSHRYKNQTNSLQYKNIIVQPKILTNFSSSYSNHNESYPDKLNNSSSRTTRLSNNNCMKKNSYWNVKKRSEKLTKDNPISISLEISKSQNKIQSINKQQSLPNQSKTEALELDFLC